VVDLGMPRNVEALDTEVPGITVLDLDSLPGHTERHAGLDTARRLVADETASYLESRAARRAGDLLAGVTERAEQVRRDELERVHLRLTETEQALLDEVTRRLVGKLLHPALVGIRDLAAAGDLASAGRVAALLDEATLEIASPPRIAG